MNVREGVRRIFLVLAVGAALASAFSTSKAFPTESQHLEFWTQAVQMELEAQSGSRIEWPPEARGEGFIRNFCERSPVGRLGQTCERFKSDNASLRSRQWEAGGWLLASGLLSFALVWLLWRVLDWVLAGFQRPGSSERPTAERL